MKRKPSVILINLVLLGLGLVLAFGFFGLGQAEAALYPAAKIIVLTEDSDVTIEMLPATADLNNLFGLWSPERRDIGYGHSLTPGTVIDLGRYPAGTELIFFISNSREGTWFTGPGERNSDGQVHAVVTEMGFQTWEVGFEDLRGGGDRDFDDVVFIIRGDIYIDEPPYNNPPVAEAGGPYAAFVGSSVAFDGSGSSDPDGDQLQYRWDFDNDGNWDTEWTTDPMRLLPGIAFIRVRPDWK